MRRLVTAILLAVALSVAAVAGPSPSPAGAHPFSGETWDICIWWRNYYFGNNSSVIITNVHEVHWWGSHQVRCDFGTRPLQFLYDRISGARAFI